MIAIINARTSRRRQASKIPLQPHLHPKERCEDRPTGFLRPSHTPLGFQHQALATTAPSTSTEASTDSVATKAKTSVIASASTAVNKSTTCKTKTRFPEEGPGAAIPSPPRKPLQEILAFNVPAVTRMGQATPRIMPVKVGSLISEFDGCVTPSQLAANLHSQEQLLTQVAALRRIARQRGQGLPAQHLCASQQCARRQDLQQPRRRAPSPIFQSQV